MVWWHAHDPMERAGQHRGTREAYSSLDELLIVLAGASDDAALLASSNRVELGSGHSEGGHLTICKANTLEQVILNASRLEARAISCWAAPDGE